MATFPSLKRDPNLQEPDEEGKIYGTPQNPAQAGVAAAPAVASQRSQDTAASGGPDDRVAGVPGGGAGTVGLFPSLRRAYSDVGNSISGAINRGDYAGAAGAATVGALAKYGNAALDDFVVTPIRTVNSFSRPTAAAGLRFGAGAVGTTLSPETEKMLSGEAPAPTVPTTTGLRATGAGAGRSSPGFVHPEDMRGLPPSDPRSRDFTDELNKVPAQLPSDLREGVVHKTVDPKTGRVTYSGRNVAPGADGQTQFVDGTGRSLTPKGSIATSAGAPVMGGGGYAVDNNAPTGEAKQAAIDAALRGPNGNKMSPQDVAIMAANQRDGVDLYRGTSQDQSLRGGGGAGAGGGSGPNMNSLMELAKTEKGTPGRKAALMMLQQLTANQGSEKVARIGAETAMAGHMMTRNSNLARMQYDMAKDQRDFATGRSDKNFEQRQAAQKAADERIDARFVDPATGKTDAAAANAYKQFVNNGIADEVARLKASKDPNDQAAAAKLAGRSYADMDANDLQALEKLWQNRSAAQKASGWTPGSGHFVESLRPQDWQPKGVDKRMFAGDQVQFSNGSRASVNDLTGSGMLNIMPKSTSMFDETIREAQAAQKLRRE